MARSTRHTGPSITDAEAADPDLPRNLARIPRAEIGFVDRKSEEEEPFPGNSSSAFIKNEGQSDEQSNPSPQQPAPTTENPSNQPEKVTADSAPSMGTVGQKTASRAKARTRVVADEFDEFD